MPATIIYPASYANALEILNGKQRTKLGHNTWLEATGNYVSIVYHRTPIVTLGDDYSVTLNNGGYYTRTTKDRISGALRALGIGSLYQERGEWYMHVKGSKPGVYKNGPVLH